MKKYPWTQPAQGESTTPLTRLDRIRLCALAIGIKAESKPHGSRSVLTVPGKSHGEYFVYDPCTNKEQAFDLIDKLNLLVEQRSDDRFKRVRWFKDGKLLGVAKAANLQLAIVNCVSEGQRNRK